MGGAPVMSLHDAMRAVFADMVDDVEVVERERDEYRGLLIELRSVVGAALGEKIDGVLNRG